ncbi:CO or xanthine dehydrogenase, Mo-binding subunit [Devosia enhydra]|uniref:CO or xanthine dehydrogenase, Mo-binding subunit n=1 Tax=Devosia enhydra TaxID=665118 RepID=A0A1K2HT84_9HYPH|nr:molybdopterin cofactor-binding domain-containing protein [Devosia enhydra]SFZ81255.1 CO or xanthine dehydrogenase, Mo-binding subunit [Devosia enhydra]
MNLMIDRRTFLKGTGGFLAVSFLLPSAVFAQQAAANAGPELPGDLRNHPQLSSWLRINADGTVNLFIGKVELGQGALTAVGQVAAEELVIDFNRLVILAGDTELCPDEGTTAGSQTMPNCAPAVQQAAAEIRAILRKLAAEKLGVGEDTLTLADGTITSGGQSVTYWDLVADLQLEVDATGTAPLLPIAEHKVIGQNIPRVDIPAKMTGEAIFVQEMNPEGVLYGAIARPPTYKATLNDVDLAPIEAMPGVRQVIRNGSFLGVIAERQDQAWAAADALERTANWNVPTGLPGHDGMEEWLLTAEAEEKEWKNTVRADGTAVAETYEAQYYRPYHMHGSIGTSAAIAQKGEDGKITVWTHSQSVWATAAAIEKMLGLAEGMVHAIHTEGSGCYGHNMADDAAADACLLANAMPGTPIKLQYTRAGEHKWEPYGSAMVNKLSATLDAEGNILDWEHHIYSTPHGSRPGGNPGNLLSARYLDPPFEQPTPNDGGPPNFSATRNGLTNYELPGERVVTHFIREMPLRVSSTRGLGAYANVVAIEQFIDELAVKAGADPVEYRLRFLKDERMRDVLTRCAEAFGWDNYERQPNRGRGIAIARYKNYAAMTAVAVEVQVTRRNGLVRVLRAVTANDGGHIVSPDGMANQVEGGAIQAFSWALKEEVKFDNTQVLSTDWASYPILTFGEVPPVENVLIDRPGEPYLGNGESSQGPAGAAVANAIADAIGTRMRHGPYTPDRVLDAIRNA